MQNRPLSPFHAELFNYLLTNVEKKIQEEGMDHGKELVLYKETLKNITASEESHSFVEILEAYHRLFFEKKNLPIEKKMLEAFPSREFPLNISRGLPRIYNKENPSISYIKKEFSSLPFLKSLGIERFTLPLYENTPIPKEAKISLFTYMLPDGWGDFIAHVEIMKILKKKFPQNEIQSILCIPKSFPLKNLDPLSLVISYTKDCPPKDFPKEVLETLSASDLIISTPAFYPHTEELKGMLKNQSKPSFLSIGQYGFIESPWFHPRSANYSMGLHFLEKGILIREQMEKGDFRTLQNKNLLFTLFGTSTPQSVDVETYKASHKFYFAYLLNPIGGSIYLHALLHSEMNHHHNIDICSPNLGWFIEYIKKQQKENKPLLEEDFGIQEIEVHFDKKIHRHRLSSTGKKVRILCPGSISDGDFRKILALSEEFIAVRGDQSFSEAVSANKRFFYDGAPHARYFVKDLLALAENRLGKNQSALSFFRCIGQSFLYSLEEDSNHWVEETAFQERRPPLEIAKTLSLSLQAASTLAGCKQLNQIIREEYAFNKTVCQMVSRELSYRFFPEKGRKEKAAIQAFAEGKLSLKETLSSLTTQNSG